MMEMIVGGSNLFGQWCSDAEIFKQFTKIKIRDIAGEDKNEETKLEYISWAYNIFSKGDKYYISGAFGGKENVFLHLQVPPELREVKIDYLAIIGNDDYLLLLDKRGNDFWKLNLGATISWEWTKLPNIINPDESPPKRMRTDDFVIKAVTKDNNYICLTHNGVVYGIHSKVDTSHQPDLICNVDCGFEHMVALTVSGKIYTWGSNRRCQLGLGDLKSRSEPTLVFALEDVKIVKISAGGWHTLALSEGGTVYSWGWNNAGQLGVHDLHTDGSPSTAIPVVVDFYDEKGNAVDVTAKGVACGNRHSAVLDNTNTVWTTGYNNHGQIGVDPNVLPVQRYFRKVFTSPTPSFVTCGPWSTVLITKKIKKVSDNEKPK